MIINIFYQHAAQIEEEKFKENNRIDCSKNKINKK
jgi:hypothetical protein